MIKANDAILEQAIRQFQMEYIPGLRQLIEQMDKAHISHYASGFGNREATFQIFPASAFVKTLIDMVTLDRAYIGKLTNGFKDASEAYNPVSEFIGYIRRWSGFAEQIMRSDGDAECGVAAARAKLIMDDLLVALNPLTLASEKPVRRIVVKSDKELDLFDLMKKIGRVLEARDKAETTYAKTSLQKNADANYRKALAAAQGSYAHPQVA